MAERFVRFNGPEYSRVTTRKTGEQIAFTVALSDVGTCENATGIEFYTVTGRSAPCDQV